MKRFENTGGVIDQDYLRPAAIKLGVLTKDDPPASGFTTYATRWPAIWSRKRRFDPKRRSPCCWHANINTTLEIYTHAGMDSNLVAQQQMMG